MKLTITVDQVPEGYNPDKVLKSIHALYGGVLLHTGLRFHGLHLYFTRITSERKTEVESLFRRITGVSL